MRKRYEEALQGGARDAASLADLVRGIGTTVRGKGLPGIPGFLLDGNYHLVRHGPLGMLHLRSPKSDHELERLDQVICLPLRENAVESRQQEPSSEVAAGAEDDEGASGHPSTLARRPARRV